MKDNKQITSEYIRKLEKRLAYIEKRNKTLKKCNDNLTEARRDLNVRLRAERYMRETLIQILFYEVPDSYGAIQALLNRFDQLVIDNRNLRDELETLRFNKTIENARSFGIDSVRHEFKDSKTDQVSKVVAWFHSLS